MRHPSSASPRHTASFRSRFAVSIPYRRALLLGLAMVLAGGPALALPPERDEADMWVPSIGFQTGLTFERAAGTVVSSPVTGNQAPTGVAQPLRPMAQGSNLMVTPFAGISVELMSPRFVEGWGNPRLFIHGDVGYSFGSTFDLAKDGVPGELNVAPGILLSTGLLSEATVSGQGSTTSADVQPLQVNAGIGISFHFDVGDTRIRIKPSLEYLREEVKVTGVLTRAIQMPDRQSLDDFRLVNFVQRTDKVFHEIGPGIQIEADVARWGPVIFAPYIGTQAFYSLTGRRANLRQAQDPPCTPPLCTPPAALESATWNYKKDRWTYRANAGLRLRFAPK